MEYPQTEGHEYQIRDSSRNYYTMIPNIVFDLGLSVHAVRLYCEIKRIAGDSGKSWVNTQNLAQRCNMSTGSVSGAKEELVAAHLISITEQTNPHGGKKYHVIEIEDIWSINQSNFQEKYKTNSPVEEASSTGEFASSTGELNNNHNNNNPKTRVPRTKEEILESTKVSLEKSLLKRQLSNAETYPVDVREVLSLMEELWKIKSPLSKTQKAFWIQSSRELIDACGEFGVTKILSDIRQGFESYMASHQGLPPFSVNSPKSLVNSARGEAGKLRIKLTEKPKPEIPMASEVWMGGVCYINGVPV